MISTNLLNLIVSLVAIGMLVAVLRVAHLAAGGGLGEGPASAKDDAPSELERAA